jgi:hypothetical protein
MMQFNQKCSTHSNAQYKAHGGKQTRGVGKVTALILAARPVRVLLSLLHICIGQTGHDACPGVILQQGLGLLTATRDTTSTQSILDTCNHYSSATHHPHTCMRRENGSIRASSGAAAAAGVGGPCCCCLSGWPPAFPSWPAVASGTRASAGCMRHAAEGLGFGSLMVATALRGSTCECGSRGHKNS